MLFKSCLVAALLCLASALPQINNINHDGRIPGEFLITLRPAPQTQKAAYVQSAVSQIVALSNAVVIDQFDALESPILHVHAEDQAISKAFDIAQVVAIDANVRVKAIEQCGSQNSGSTYWGLSRTSSRAPPNYSNARYSYRTNGGSGVRVYVLDTSIRTSHQDFGGRAVFGTNTIGGGNGDGNGHGTHCAGTVLGTNSGVAKGATAVAVKVVDDRGFGSTANCVDGINWAVNDARNRGRAVISMSLGYPITAAIDSAVSSATSANIPVVVAAGNENQNACNVSPARASSAITVGATTNGDALASYSNWGNCVDILAPGSNVRSAYINSDSSYASLSGTSMACPHVAGAAAVYLQQNPH